MRIRYAKENEKKSIKDIWNYCFRDGEEFVKYYFENKYRNYNTVVVEEDKDIISSLQLNQYKINLNNKEYDTSYVVGVSTFPQARGKGYMRDMMDFMLDELYKKGQLISILMPIDYRLYRKYGYEHCYDQIEYNLDIDDLKEFAIKGELNKVSEDNIAYMEEINNEFLRNNNGFVYRNEHYYKNLLKEVKSEGGYIYIHKSEQNSYDGYIIYFLIEDKMFVRELFYKNMDSLKSILKFIYNHNTQCKKATINTPINDKIKFILPNLRTNDIKIKPFMMGRIINFKEYIKSIDLINMEDISIKLKLEDNQIEANNKTFKISIIDNVLNIEESNEVEDVCLDINIMTQIAFSYVSLEEALFIYDIQIKGNVKNVMYLFNNIFSKKYNYINEYV